MGSRSPDGESRSERLDRNWSELLQELRVIQTGVQVLTGFLLTVPFNNRFTELTALQQHTYLGVLSGAIASTALLLTPGACHRVLFHQGERPWLITTANRLALAGLALVALTTAGVAFLVFDIVLGRSPGILAAGVALVLFAALWFVVPGITRRRGRDLSPGNAPRPRPR